MPNDRPARSLRCALVAATILASSLTAAQPGRGARGTDLVALDIDEQASLRLDDLERGELKIDWRREGPVLALGELRTKADSGRTYAKGSAAPPIDGCYLLAPFEYSRRNRFGGATRLRGRAREELVLAEPGASRHALRFEFEDGPTSPRMELSLHDAEPTDGTVFYLDGRQFDHFELRLRGAGDGRVTATLVDAHGRRSAATPLSDGSLGYDWRTVRIATDLAAIHRHHLARLELRGHGSGAVEIDDVYLCRADAVPERAAPRRQRTSNALWVWHTSDLLAAGPAAVDDLLELSRRAGIGRIFLQVPGGLDNADTRQALAVAVRRLGSAGIRLLALDGAPEYALPSEHDDLLATVAKVVGYNEAVAPEARFVGVHLDVEPYLLDEWRAARDETVAGYLGMLDAIRASTDDAGLQFDVAVPFWFDTVAVDRARGDRVERVSLTDAVLQRVDSIAVMDYRTQTGGSNGLLALGAGELAAAAEQGRDVWIGLETTWLPDQTLVRFRGVARAGLPAASDQPWWVVETPGTLWAVPGQALEQLRRRLQDVEPADMRHWPAGAVEVPATRQTFYDLGFDALLAAMRETSSRLAGHPAFAGLALHYDRPLRRLMDAARK